MRFVLTAGLLLAASAAAAQAPPVVVKQIFSGAQTAAGQPIVLPQGAVQVTVTTYDIAPGAKLAVHEHPYPRYAYVLAGTIRVTDVEAGKSTDYPPGSMILELIGRWHFGENIGTEPVRLLVIDQLPPGEKSTILRPD